MRKLLPLFLLLVLPQLNFAQSQDEQTYKFKGVIIRAKTQLPLAGADVFFRGRAVGVKTDDQGFFKIEGYRRDSVLTFSFNELETKEERVSDTSLFYTVTLEDIAETFPTGLGVMERKFQTSSSFQVSGNAISQQNNTSFDAGLQGLSTGLLSRQSTGIQAALSALRIRGISSIYGSSAPLIVIDGLPVVTGVTGDDEGSIGQDFGFQTTPLAEFNQDDIASAEVLKDGAATAAFGARGGSGVILITTKKGRPGKTKFGINYYTGITSLENKVAMADGNQYINAGRSAFRNSFGADPSDNLYLTGGQIVNLNPTNTDWLNKSLQTGMVRNLYASASGGNKRVNFYFGGGFRQEKSVITGAEMDRLNLRFNAENQATNRLTIGLKTLISFSNSTNPVSGLDTNGGFGAAQYRALPVLPVFVANRTDFNPFFNPYSGANIEATQNQEYSSNKRQVFRNLATVYANYEITKSLKFFSETGVEYLTQTDRIFRSRFIRKGLVQNSDGTTRVEPFSSAIDTRTLYFTLSFNNGFRWEKTIDSNHRFQAVVGTTFQRTLNSFNGAGSERFPNDYSQQVSAGAIPFGSGLGNVDGFAFNSYYLNANYIGWGKWITGFTLRADASSRFGQDINYGYFPAVSAGYILSESQWFKNLLADKAANYFAKLRVSYGSSGNSAFENNVAKGYWRGGAPYIDNPNFVPGRFPYRVENTYLRWERVYQANLGLDFNTTNGRVTASVDFFNKVTNNAVLPFALPPSLGMDNGFILENGATIINRGLELALSTVNIRQENFEWSTTLNLNFLKNEVSDMGGLGNLFAPNVGSQTIREGQPIGIYYLPKWAGLATEDDPNGNWKKGDELVYNAQGNKFRPTSLGQLDSARVAINGKSYIPNLFGGLTNTLRFYQFELSALITFSAGGYILDEGERRQSYFTGSNNLRSSALQSGANLYYSGNTGSGNVDFDPLAFRNTDRFLHKADYVRLRNVMLSWKMPQKISQKAGIGDVKIFIAAQNLLTFTGFKGWDPESFTNLQGGLSQNLGMGTTAFDLPTVRSFYMGVNVSF